MCIRDRFSTFRVFKFGFCCCLFLILGLRDPICLFFILGVFDPRFCFFILRPPDPSACSLYFQFLVFLYWGFVTPAACSLYCKFLVLYIGVTSPHFFLYNGFALPQLLVLYNGVT